DPELGQDLVRGRAADAVDVRQADLDALVEGDVDAGDASHCSALLQPCRCLWRGFWQITSTRPWRRMILHFSHIGLTDGPTFMIPFGGRVPATGSGCRCGRRYRIVDMPARTPACTPGRTHHPSNFRALAALSRRSPPPA